MYVIKVFSILFISYVIVNIHIEAVGDMQNYFWTGQHEYAICLNRNDTIAPVIHLVGVQDTTVIVGSNYIDPGAIVEDNIDHDLKPIIDYLGVNTSTEGRYFVKFSASDNSGNKARCVYRVINVRSSKIQIGVRKIYSTPVGMGTWFVAPEALGAGDGLTPENACSFSYFDTVINRNNKNKALTKIKPGDVIFFREGVYKIEPFSGKLDTFHTNSGAFDWISLHGGTKDLPVTYESYPGEKAVFTCPDSINATDRSEIRIYEDHVRLRNIEIKGMPKYGLYVFGKHCIVEGCDIHHNDLSGVEQVNRYNSYKLNDEGASYNIYRDNKFHHNSDVGYYSDGCNNGGNADGIVIHQGMYNVVEHNEIYNNSDDGFDGWRSFGTQILYNKIYHNGKKYNGGTGDGSGLKMGGYPNEIYSDPEFGCYHVAKHNLLYENSKQGQKENACRFSILSYNTSYNNLSVGYTLNSTITEEISLSVVRNIAFANERDYSGCCPIYQSDNSWNASEGVVESNFISLDISSADFLRPTSVSPIKNMGAYADEENIEDITPPVVGPKGERKITIEKGDNYIEKGARAFDDRDGWITDISIDDGGLNTKLPGSYTVTYSATDASGNTGTGIRVVEVK